MNHRIIKIQITCTSSNHGQDICKKVQIGKDQEKAQSERDSHSKIRDGKNQTNNQAPTL